MKTPTSSNGAFSLVEVTLSLGITAFCLLAVFGLIPVGITSNQASVEQSMAANVATSIVADLRAVPITSPPTEQTSRNYKVPIPAQPGGATSHTVFFRADGKISGTPNANAIPADSPFYRAMLTVGKDPQTRGTATVVRVLITWPALGDRAANQDPKNFTGSFETVIALNRN